MASSFTPFLTLVGEEVGGDKPVEREVVVRWQWRPCNWRVRGLVVKPEFKNFRNSGLRET